MDRLALLLQPITPRGRQDKEKRASFFIPCMCLDFNLISLKSLAVINGGRFLLSAAPLI